MNPGHKSHLTRLEKEVKRLRGIVRVVSNDRMHQLLRNAEQDLAEYQKRLAEEEEQAS